MNSQRLQTLNTQIPQGFTLLEVLVAIAVTAMVAAMAAGAFNSAEKANERTKKALENMQRLDRAWVTIETDLRNGIGRMRTSADGDAIPAMVVDETEEYFLSLLRGGRPNPMHFYRSEMARVRYSVNAEQVLVRELWNDPANLDEDWAHTQFLLSGVEEVRVRLLPPGGGSVQNGPWVDEWPPRQALAALPRAVEITLVLEHRGEIRRLFPMLPGL